MGKPQIHLITTSCSLLINIFLNLWLIPIKGITGAAIASCISYFIYGVFYLVFFIKKEQFSIYELFSISLSDLKLLWSSK
jgi:Na+-driven multidrug efflux pump